MLFVFFSSLALASNDWSSTLPLVISLNEGGLKSCLVFGKEKHSCLFRCSVNGVTYY